MRIRARLESDVRTAVASALDDLGVVVDLDEVEWVVKKSQRADFQFNGVLAMAKHIPSAWDPSEIAHEIAGHLDGCPSLARAEASGPGFINLTLCESWLEELLGRMFASDRLGVETQLTDTVVIDYAGPNIAKEMHIGHLRSTIIGDALANILEFLGCRVIRQSHQGDWGTQFGMLVEHRFETCHDVDGHDAVADLETFYRHANARFETDEDFAQRARQRVVQLQGGDPETLEAWRSIVEVSQGLFDEVYGRLDVGLTRDDVAGESFYNPMLDDVIAELEAKGLVVESEGALCAYPPGFADREGEPLGMVVRKSGGGYLYATTDLAALRYRTQILGANRLIYVTDHRQALHFAMVFAVAKLAGWLRGVVAEHAPFGSVLGPDGRPLKTREGGTVKLRELVDEAERRAGDLMRERMGEAGDPALVHHVAVGAIKYSDLANDRASDYRFDWSRMLRFEGNTAPYIQYANVRARSILRKAEWFPPSSCKIRVEHPAERSLALALLDVEDAMVETASALSPHRLCAYLYDVATSFTRFYEACPVLVEGDVRESRLGLTALVSRVLERGLSLLGIAAPERM